MADVGYGYGSEWHLLRFLGYHRNVLDSAILGATGGMEHRFLRWVGDHFEALGAGAEVNHGAVEQLAQAPDGSVWAVGNRRRLRWQPFHQEWRLYERWPRPSLLDRDGTPVRQ